MLPMLLISRILSKFEIFKQRFNKLSFESVYVPDLFCCCLISGINMIISFLSST